MRSAGLLLTGGLLWWLQVDALLQELSPAPEHEAAAAEAVERLRLLLLALPAQERSCQLVGNFARALHCVLEVRTL